MELVSINDISYERQEPGKSSQEQDRFSIVRDRMWRPSTDSVKPTLAERALISEFTQACSEGNADIVEKLKNQASYEDLGKGFINACKKGHLNILEMLKDLPDLNSFLYEGLYQACQHGRAAVAEFLITRMRAELSETIFCLACQANNPTIIKVVTRYFIPSKTILARAMIICSSEGKEVAVELLKDDPQLAPSAIALGFHQACENGFTAVVKILKDHPALTLEDLNNGLNLAWEKNHEEIINLLTEMGAQLTFPEFPITVPLDNHPLQGLSEKIASRSAYLIDAEGKRVDLGAYFHGYGKGASLNFKNAKLSDDRLVTVLSFKINNFFRTRLERLLLEFSKNDDLKIELLETFKFGESQVRQDKTPMAWKISVEGVGTLTVGKNGHFQDQVYVEVDEGKDLKDFQKLLSVIGMQDVLDPSTLEDIKRLELGFLFRIFYPQDAFVLENEEEYFGLPLDKLQERMIKKQPKMKEILATYKVERQEVLPGYVRYAVPVAEQLQSCALTTAITSSQLLKNLDIVANIVKIGLFSKEMRDIHYINGNGLTGEYDYLNGGARNIFAQMILNKAAQDQKKFKELLVYNSKFRIFFSPKVINRGSYQYNSDKLGTREFTSYALRMNIFQFQDLPHLLSDHEIMLPNRILPEEIQMIVTRSQKHKDLLIAHLRYRGLIGQDNTIRGVPIDEFIQVGTHMTDQMMKRCNPAVH